MRDEIAGEMVPSCLARPCTSASLSLSDALTRAAITSSVLSFFWKVSTFDPSSAPNHYLVHREVAGNSTAIKACNRHTKI